MKTNKIKVSGPKELKHVALYYMKTLAEVARESFLILDADLRVILANPIFYKNFLVMPKETEGRLIYDLGNGQWNIPELKKMLEAILPTKKILEDYEVTHVFEKIGEKTIQLNAMQIDSLQMIIIAMEDITKRRMLEKKLAKHAEDLESIIADRTEETMCKIKELESMNKMMIGRELKMVELKEEIQDLKKQLKIVNENNENLSL